MNATVKTNTQLKRTSTMLHLKPPTCFLVLLYVCMYKDLCGRIMLSFIFHIMNGLLVVLEIIGKDK